MSWSFASKFRSVEIITRPAFWPSVGWVALAVFLQATLAPWLSFRHAVPAFAAIPVVLYALRAGARSGAVLAIVAGALTDAVAGTAGGWTIAYTAVAFGVGSVSRGFFADGIAPPSILVTAAVVVRDAIFWIVMAIQGYPRGFGTTHLHESLWQAALTGACALVYLAVRSRVASPTRIERFG